MEGWVGLGVHSGERKGCEQFSQVLTEESFKAINKNYNKYDVLYSTETDRHTLRVRSPGSTTFLYEMTSRHGRHLEIVTSYQKTTDVYLVKEQYCQIPKFIPSRYKTMSLIA